MSAELVSISFCSSYTAFDAHAMGMHQDVKYGSISKLQDAAQDRRADHAVQMKRMQVFMLNGPSQQGPNPKMIELCG